MEHLGIKTRTTRLFRWCLPLTTRSTFSPHGCRLERTFASTATEAEVLCRSGVCSPKSRVKRASECTHHIMSTYRFKTCTSSKHLLCIVFVLQHEFLLTMRPDHGDHGVHGGLHRGCGNWKKSDVGPLTIAFSWLTPKTLVYCTYNIL